MANILFFPDVYLEQGHWLPAVSLGQALQAKGHTVNFMGIADCETIATSYGFTFYKVFADEYPLGYTRANQYKSVNERWKPDHLWDIIGGGLDDVMKTVKPDLIISGYFASLETLIIHYKYGLKFMTTTTYLRHPDDDPAIRAIQNLVGMSEPMARKVISGATADVADYPYDPDDIYGFVRPLGTVHELVPCPRAFEFANYVFDTDTNPVNGRVHFVEPCVTRTKTSDALSKEPDIWEGIPSGVIAEKRILFATAGSQVQDYKDKARRWFREMINMMGMQGMQDYHLIISVGPDLINEDWDLPDNVSMFQWVPQLKVLSNCAAAFIHGGLATIKECIFKGVPFIVLPLGKDQMDNALRVRRCAIGQIGYPESVTMSTLQNLFLQAISNTWMNGRLKEMQLTFETNESNRTSIPVIESVLNANS